MKRIRTRIGSILLSMALILTLLPVTALAEGKVAEITISSATTSYTDAASFETAVESMESGTEASIKLLDNVTINGTTTAAKVLAIQEGTTVTLDLNGYTLTVTTRLANSGALTVKDSSESGTGMIVSNGTSGIYIGSNASLTVTGGTIQAKKAIEVYGSPNAHITILGGTIRSTSTIHNARYAAICAAKAASLVIGNGTPEADSKIVIDGEKAYGIVLPEGAGTTQIKGGWISSFYGSFENLTEFNAKLGEPVDDVLPAGKVSVAHTDASSGQTYYQIEDLTNPADVAATIGADQYASVKAAIANLKDGETLVLQKDFTANEQVKITAVNATLDLNGHDVTNTASYGVYANTSGGPTTGGTFCLKNSNSKTSTVSATSGSYAALYLYGPSKGNATLLVEGNITLQQAKGNLVKLSNAKMAYSESAAAMMGNGGFKATESDGNSYIYGGYDDAAEADVNSTAVLLNNYSGMDNLEVPAGASYVVDLNGHTYTVTSTISNAAAINLSKENASLIVKNGDLISLLANGAFLNADNASLTLENVDLSVPNDTYGIVTSGNYSGISINLIGGSVSSKSDGTGIYFPSDGSTLVIDGTAVTSDTALAVKGGTVTIRGEAVLHGTGPRRTLDAAQGSGTNQTGAAVYLEGNYQWDTTVNIESGYFISDQAEAVQMLFADETYVKTISITGGYFTSDPSAYLAEGKAAVASDKDGYAYMVGTAGDTPAQVVAGEAEVTPDLGEDATEQETKFAGQVAEALTDPDTGGIAVPSIGQDLNSAAGTVANQNTVTADTTVEDGKTVQEALDALDESTTVSDEDITIVVQPYLDIKVTDVSIDNEAGTKTVTLDITPMYITVATTADLDGNTPDKIVIAGENVSGANAIQVGEAKELPISKPVEVTLPLPSGFAGNGTLYVKHEKTPGTVYYYTGSVDSNVLTFTNPHGFSKFTLMSTNEAKAETGGVGYPSLQAAVNAVTDKGTITVLGTETQSAVVSREVTFTLTGDGADAATITAGSGYQLTKNDDTYTVTRLPETSDEPSSGGSSSGGSGSSDDGDYSVSVPSSTSIQGGSITVSPRSADKGDTVTITVKPDDGYVLNKLTVTTRAGAAVDLTRKSDTRYTFTMPGSSVVIDVSFVREGTSAEMAFTDVPESFWAYSEIQWAYDNGYMNGTSASTFNPNGTVNRQQVWMILARMAGASPANMAEAKAWAVENGISDGTNPTGAVTRQQLVALLYRFASQNGYNVSNKADLSSYPDAASVASYAAEPMAWAVANGIIGGTTAGTLNAAGNSNRAQLAVILWRFYQTTAG